MALLAVFIPIVAIVIFSHIENLKERRQARLDDLAGLNRAIVASVDGFAHDLETFTLSTSLTLSKALDAGYPISQDTLGPYFRDLSDSYGVLRSIFVTDRDGRVLAGTSGNVGFDVSSRPYIKALQAGADSVWSNALAGQLTGQTTIAYGRPIRNADGGATYFLVIAFYPAELAKRLPAGLPDDANVSLIDRNGIVLFTSGDQNPEKPVLDVSASPVFRAARAGRPAMVESERSPVDDDDRYAAFQFLDRPGWVVGITRPTAAIDAPLQSRFRRDMLLLGGALLGGLAIMLALANRLSRPLSELANAASAIARGEHPVVPTAAADADVRQLELAMETMSKAIATRETRLREEAERLERAREELQRSDQSKDELLGIIGHELRTPLTTILGSSQRLIRRWQTLPERERAELVQVVEHESRRMAALLENLMILARAELELAPESATVSVDQLIGGVIQQIHRVNPVRTIVVDNRLGNSTIMSDAMRLNQILLNLMDNANKYSPADQPIDVVLERRGGDVEMRILDRGPGVEPDELKLLFNSFYRSPRTAAQRGGKGLGLAVCKRLVESLSGEIWARLRSDGGLEVGFSLPASSGEEATMPAQDQPVR